MIITWLLISTFYSDNYMAVVPISEFNSYEKCEKVRLDIAPNNLVNYKLRCIRIEK